MLKYSIIIALTCLFKAVYSVPSDTYEKFRNKLNDVIPLVNGKAVYIETVDCGTVSQTELFRRARIWLSQSNPEMTVQVADKETGDLVTRGLMTVTQPRSEISAGSIYNFHYALTIECVNRKYRTTISHIELLDNTGSVPLEKISLKSSGEQGALYAALDKKFEMLLQDLQTNIKEYKPL